MNTLKCRKCQQEKLAELFPKKGKQCKACVSERDKAYVEKNRTSVQARKNLWQQEKRRADKARKPIKLTALQEAKLAGKTRYFTGVPCTNGHVAERLVSSRACIVCQKIHLEAYKGKNREAYLAKARDAEKARREHFPERIAEIRRKTTAKHRERRNAEKASWARKNASRVLAWARQRQLAKIQRTPAWLSEDDYWVMEQAYELASMRTARFGFQWHVDHVIPLRGKKVSGLHVPGNLRVIPGSENSRKGNRMEVA